MKLECGKENLEKAIQLAEKISGRTLTLPVLNCLVLTAKKNTLSVRATNLDLGIEIVFPSKTNEEGIIAVPSYVIRSTIAALGSTDTVVLSSSHNNLVITTKNGKTTIKTLPHDDFPTLPIIEGGESCTLQKEVFINGFSSVWYSASTSAVKPELGSVYLYSTDNKIKFVATDSFRLAEKTITQKVSDSFGPFLVPFRNIPEILRVLEQAETDVKCTWNENQISFRFNKTYLTSRLIDGSFPDYKQIIPKETATEAVMLKHDLLATLKKTTIFSDTFNQIRFSVNPKKKEFIVRAENADVGETSDAVPAALKGDSIDIAFNHKYLTDCFQSLHTDSVSMAFAGSARPLVIRGISDPSFLYLVMPMNK